METHSIAVNVNGRRIAADVEPRLLLVYFLREQASMTGTHIGCDPSRCGARTAQIDRVTVGGASGPIGRARGGPTVRLSDDAKGTLTRCEAKAEVGGRLAQLGSRPIDSVAEKFAEELFDKFSVVVGAMTQEVRDAGAL